MSVYNSLVFLKHSSHSSAGGGTRAASQSTNSSLRNQDQAETALLIVSDQDARFFRNEEIL
jgi:hypothetical protein